MAHVDEAGHLPDWAGATSLKKDFTKTQKKIVEAAFIATEDTLNISQGFFRLASVAATLIRSEYNLRNRKNSRICIPEICVNENETDQNVGKIDVLSYP